MKERIVILVESFIVSSAISIPHYCRLNNESFVSEQDVIIRQNLLTQFRQLPIEVFSRLRHFQPQTGCFNKCSFCSQGASTRIIEFDKIAINNIIAVIKAVSLENGIKSGYLPQNTINEIGYLSPDFILPKNGLIAHQLERAGVVYCYLDNDPGLYQDLAYFVKILYDNLGVKTRIATVGFNRKNPIFNENFVKLSKEYSYCLAGVRLSISPYTYGWSDKKGFSKYEFEKDIGYFLSLFKDSLLSSDNSRKGYCVELRFKPLVLSKNIQVFYMNNHFILQFDDFAYVSIDPVKEIKTSVLKTHRNHTLELSESGVNVVKIKSKDIDGFMHNEKNVLDLFSYHKLYLLSNDDGLYYGIDCERNGDGKSFAKYFYPKTDKRPNSGFIDGERYVLNAILEKQQKQEIFSWHDVDDVILSLQAKANNSDKETYNYIVQDLIPLLETYVNALKYYDFPAYCFFDKNFTVDTGHICNLGRAYSEYRFLASRKDLPMTPNHERTFGLNSDLAKEGIVYRLAPSNERRKSNVLKKQSVETNCFLIESLDLASTATKNGQSQKVYEFNLENISIYRSKDFVIPMIPGQI